MDQHTGERDTYTLVESGEADPARGRVSVESPIAQALEGHREGEIVSVETPRARRRLRLVQVGS
ncbi:MAG TPA: GreA/GreB family elongation factor [Thermoleophilaceae bacterium]|nr:GreA/GreB family elongation factor [Thermoleophilaceae bacterium]